MSTKYSVPFVGGIILLLGILVFVLMTGDNRNMISISINEEFNLQKGQAASFGDFSIEFLEYEMKMERTTGLSGAVAKIKISSVKGSASWFEIEKVREVGDTVLYEPAPGAGTGNIPAGEGKLHLFVLKFVEKTGDDSIRLSLLDFRTMEREEFEKWQDEQLSHLED